MIVLLKTWKCSVKPFFCALSGLSDALVRISASIAENYGGVLFLLTSFYHFGLVLGLF